MEHLCKIILVTSQEGVSYEREFINFLETHQLAYYHHYLRTIYPRYIRHRLSNKHAWEVATEDRFINSNPIWITTESVAVFIILAWQTPSGSTIETKRINDKEAILLINSTGSIDYHLMPPAW